MAEMYVPKSCKGCSLARELCLDDVQYHRCNMTGEKTAYYWSRMAEGVPCKIRHRHEKQMRIDDVEPVDLLPRF